jgi:exodeoxyribonuclease VII large subunit
LLNRHPEVEVILLARGGGSLEDLWCFNEEAVARAIFASRIPVISGVGHETDITIADFVADKRAPTPTAAAEIAVPKAEDLRAALNQWERQIRRSLQNFIDFRRQLLDDYSARLAQTMLGKVRDQRHQLTLQEERMQRQILHQLDFRRQLLDDYQQRLHTAMGSSLERVRQELRLLEVQIESLNVKKILGWGYSLTLKEGEVVRDAGQLQPGDRIETFYAKGKSQSSIESTEA